MIFYNDVEVSTRTADEQVYSHDFFVLEDAPITKEDIKLHDYPDDFDIKFLSTKNDENFGKVLKEQINELMIKKILMQIVINYINGCDDFVLNTAVSKGVKYRLIDMGFSLLQRGVSHSKPFIEISWPTKDAITTVKHYYQLWGESNAFIQKASNMILLNLKSEFKEYEKFLDRGFIQASTFLSNRSKNSEDEVVAAQIKRYLKTYDFKCDISFESKCFVNITWYF